MSVMISPLNEKGQTAFAEAKERLGTGDPALQIVKLLNRVEEVERIVLEMVRCDKPITDDDPEEEVVIEGKLTGEEPKKRGRPKKNG